MTEATTTETAASPICWSEMVTKDAAAAKKFYTELFGWKTETMPMGPGKTYTMFKQGEKTFGGIWEASGPEFKDVPNHWLNYIAVDNVDASAKKAQKLGAKLCKEATDIPGMGRFAVLIDPSGAVFALWQHA